MSTKKKRPITISKNEPIPAVAITTESATCFQVGRCLNAENAKKRSAVNKKPSNVAGINHMNRGASPLSRIETRNKTGTVASVSNIAPVPIPRSSVDSKRDKPNSVRFVVAMGALMSPAFTVVTSHFFYVLIDRKFRAPTAAKHYQLSTEAKIGSTEIEGDGMRQLLVLLVVLLLQLGTVAPVSATGPFTYRALAGIKQVTVAIEHIAPDVDKTQLQTAIESRLRQSGLRVTPAEKDATFGSALYVDVYATPPSQKMPLSHFIQVSLSRNVFLSPTDSKPYGSKVWQSGAIEQLSSSKLRLSPGKVLAVVDEFINDWKAANGR